jgi:hypothetical protein
MDFMKCEFEESKTAKVYISVRDYPEHGIALEELKPMIEEIRTKSTDMVIIADLSGAGLLDIERFKMIVGICQEVIEYTKEDNLLRLIQIKGAGFIFRTLYRPISIAIPKYFRDIVVFL